MGKELVIVESPTKSKHIQKILGKDYLVLASFGHLRDLPPRDLGVDINNNFKPKYIQIKKKTNPLPKIKKAAAEADKIYLASDPDREGEAIAWHIQQLLPIKERKKCKRIVFKEITNNGVLQRIQEPGNINKNIVNAQQARRVLDRLTGFEISPILWRNIKGKTGLSAGRVQSAALKLLFDRDKEIEKFKKEIYFVIYGEFESQKETTVLKLMQFNKKKIAKINEKEANKICQLIKGSQFKILSIDTKPLIRKAPLPFETTTMLQEANRLLSFSTEKTMAIAQELFETGLITYMRTDSTRISEEARVEAEEYISKTYGKEYLITEKIKEKRGAQDAHEAIRPTRLFPYLEEFENKLSSDQFKLFSLIYKRFLASQMAPAEYMQYQLLVEGRKKKKSLLSINREFISIFSGIKQILTFPGYKVVYKEKDEMNSPNDIFFKKLQLEESIQEKEIFSEQKETEPPKLYTEATLIKKLDQLGIGRPSTYASIIKKITAKGYAEKIKNEFTISELGKKVINVLLKKFPKILDYSFTATLEEELDKVASGKLQYTAVVSSFYKEIEQAKKALQ